MHYQARDKAMSIELTGKPFIRSPNLYGDPQTTMRCVPSIFPVHPPLTYLDNSVYGYDAEADADTAIQAYLDKREPRDEKTGITNRELEKFIGWWWPKAKRPLMASKL